MCSARCTDFVVVVVVFVSAMVVVVLGCCCVVHRKGHRLWLLLLVVWSLSCYHHFVLVLLLLLLFLWSPSLAVLTVNLFGLFVVSGLIVIRVTCNFTSSEMVSVTYYWL